MTAVHAVQWTALTRLQQIEAVRAVLEAHPVTYREAAQMLGVTIGTIAGAVRDSAPRIRPCGRPKGTAARIEVLPLLPPPPPPPPPEPEPVPEPVAAAGAPHDWWAPLPGVQPRRLELHHEGQCRWPVGDKLYCCADVAPEKVYCAAHAARAYRPAPPIGLLLKVRRT